jgi:hypothetical protein
MGWMNEDEIDRCVAVLERLGSPAARFARFLADWRDVVNANSDGWAHWQGGSRPAAKLSDLVKRAVDLAAGRDRGEAPTEQEMARSLAPIRAAATRHGFQPPVLADAEPTADGPRF